MSAESDVKALLIADAPLMAILTGNVWTDEEVGVEGIRRGEDFETKIAFDENGYIKPCALVRQRGLVPINVRSHKRGDEFAATSQMVEIYFYQHRGHQMIDLAKEIVYQLLEGTRLPGTYPLIWNFETSYIPDVGPLRNTTTLRQEWQVMDIRRKNP